MRFRGEAQCLGHTVRKELGTVDSAFSHIICRHPSSRPCATGMVSSLMEWGRFHNYPHNLEEEGPKVSQFPGPRSCPQQAAFSWLDKEKGGEVRPENLPFGREHWSRAQNLISIYLGHAFNSSPGRWSQGFCPGISTPGGSSGSQAHCAANLPGMCHCGLQFCLWEFCPREAWFSSSPTGIGRQLPWTHWCFPRLPLPLSSVDIPDTTPGTRICPWICKVKLLLP